MGGRGGFGQPVALHDRHPGDPGESLLDLREKRGAPPVLMYRSRLQSMAGTCGSRQNSWRIRGTVKKQRGAVGTEEGQELLQRAEATGPRNSTGCPGHPPCPSLVSERWPGPPRSWPVGFRPLEEFLALFRTYRPTLFFTGTHDPPGILLDQQVPAMDWSRLRYINTGGRPFLRERQERFTRSRGVAGHTVSGLRVDRILPTPMQSAAAIKGRLHRPACQYRG